MPQPCRCCRRLPHESGSVGSGAQQGRGMVLQALQLQAAVMAAGDLVQLQCLAAVARGNGGACWQCSQTRHVQGHAARADPH